MTNGLGVKHTRHTWAKILSNDVSTGMSLQLSQIVPMVRIRENCVFYSFYIGDM